MRTIRARIVAVGAVAALLLTPTAGVTASAGGHGHGHSHSTAEKITVMSRNIYLGGDINRPVVAAATAEAQGKTPQEIVVALANATHETRAIIDRTNFPVRARLLAKEIAKTRPDLVGLQEVAMWRSGPLELTAVGTPNATTVDYDYLQILLKQLARQGARYRAVNVGMRADVEAPSFTGSPFDGSIAGTVRDVRMTMRDVILMRVDRDLRVTDSGDAAYEHNLAITVAGVPLNFTRGYNWVDVKAGKEKLRFVNTHLEAFSSDLAYAQAAELLSDATSARRTNVIVCDCNSDPLNSSIKPVDTLPHKAAYDLITGTGDFTDEWLRWAPAHRGWTSGLSETVDDATGAGFDHRIDMVFARTPSGHGLKVDRGQITGDERRDRDRRTGLWPSDHAGVVLRLSLGGR